MSRILLLIFTLILIVAACSNEPNVEIPAEIASLENLQVVPADASPLHQIELERAAHFGDTDDVMIGRLGLSTVGDNGNVYLADASQNVIYAYNRDGTFLTQIGREGDGPGEFRQIRNMQVEGDRLHVMDMSTMRISTFDLNSYRFIRDLTIPFEYDFSGGFSNFPRTIHLYDDDHFLMHFGISYSMGESSNDDLPMEHGKLMSRSDGSFGDEKVYEFKAAEVLRRVDDGGMYIMPVNYKRGTQFTFTGNQIVWGWTEDLLFKVHDIEGNYVSAVYQPYQNRPLIRSEVLSDYEDRTEPWRSMIRNDNMPETWPAFSNVIGDDEGRIWASVYTDDDEVWNWRVYTHTGELYANFQWPREIQIRDIRDGYVYTRETDEETGLVEIVKYRIQLN